MPAEFGSCVHVHTYYTCRVSHSLRVFVLKLCSFLPEYCVCLYTGGRVFKCSFCDNFLCEDDQFEHQASCRNWSEKI